MYCMKCMCRHMYRGRYSKVDLCIHNGIPGITGDRREEKINKMNNKSISGLGFEKHRIEVVPRSRVRAHVPIFTDMWVWDSI